RERLGRLPRSGHERAGEADRGGDTAFERVDARLERQLRRVHDAGVDVADLGEGEQVRRAVGVAQVVRGGLVDRNRSGARRRVGISADVDLLGLEAPGVTHKGETVASAIPDQTSRNYRRGRAARAWIGERNA